MAVTQYIGARYVPLFAEPLQWDSDRTYEPLTIVYDGGNSYTSRQYVPAGVSIDDTAFWALTGNYNAQIEQYREEVKTAEAAVKAETARATAAEATKAPIAHASTQTTYGVGNQTNYGHVKLAAASDANAGIAATPATVNTSVNAAKTELNQSIAAVQANVTALDTKVSSIGRITSLYVIGDSYLEGYNPDGNVTGYGQLIKQSLKITSYREDAQGGTKWDANTKSRIKPEINSYDALLIALGHNNMTSNSLSVGSYVADVLNTLESQGYKGRVYLCSTITTARYACTRMFTVDESIISGMRQASYSFPCMFIANGWSWLIDSADYGTTDNGQHPKQAGQNLIAANIISGMFGGNTLNAGHSYGAGNGVTVNRVMTEVVITVSGSTGNDGTILYNPKLPFRCLEVYFLLTQGNDGSVKHMSFKDAEGAKVTYGNITNGAYGTAITTLLDTYPS